MLQSWWAFVFPTIERPCKLPILNVWGWMKAHSKSISQSIAIAIQILASVADREPLSWILDSNEVLPQEAKRAGSWREILSGYISYVVPPVPLDSLRQRRRKQWICLIGEGCWVIFSAFAGISAVVMVWGANLVALCGASSHFGCNHLDCFSLKMSKSAREKEPKSCKLDSP